MERADAIVVGAGPAGSECARLLARAGWSVLLLEKAVFPRDKLCAGWVTPAVFELLDLEPEAYEGEGRTLARPERFVVWDREGNEREIAYGRVVSYGVVRREFDAFLAGRCEADLREGVPVRDLRRDRGEWIVSDSFQAPWLIGAGGHFCPVARHLGARVASERAVVSLELEVRLPPEARERLVRYPNTAEFAFCDDLNGYGWYFSKGEAINIGLGRLGKRGVRAHLARFLEKLRAKGRLPAGEAFSPDRFRGHAYKIHGIDPRRRAAEGVLLIGDSAGVARNFSGEGIGPSVLSARLAARALIEAGSRADTDLARCYQRELDRALGAPLTGWRRLLWSAVPGFLPRLAGGMALRSDRLIRRVVLDRFFLGFSPGDRP